MRNFLLVTVSQSPDACFSKAVGKEVACERENWKKDRLWVSLFFVVVGVFLLCVCVFCLFFCLVCWGFFLPCQGVGSTSSTSQINLYVI